MTRLALAAAIVGRLAAQAAAADCNEGPARCAMQEDGKRLLDAGQFADAATKYKQSIAIRPSARAYLGLYRAALGLGRTALAYEALVAARGLNEVERKESPDDADVASRAESITFKLNELAPRIAFVRLRLPEGAVRDDVTAVRREAEDELADPFGRRIAVAADNQALSVTLRTGETVAFTVHVASGVEQELDVPVAIKHATPQAPVVLVGAPLRHTPRHDTAVTATVGAVVLLAGALVFDLWGSSTYDTAVHEADNSAQLDAWHSANDKRHAALGLLAAGIGCAGLATWLWVRTPADDHPRAARLAPFVDTRTAGLQVGGRW
jgi:hypothetical protein